MQPTRLRSPRDHAAAGYAPYGNCGEGGRVGACLALKAGFSKGKIRTCASSNDHFFAMVKQSDPAQKWCVLDRWPLVASDNFACGVDWDEAGRGVTHNGVNMPQKWFQDVKCIDFGSYLKAGAWVK